MKQKLKMQQDDICKNHILVDINSVTAQDLYDLKIKREVFSISGFPGEYTIREIDVINGNRYRVVYELLDPYFYFCITKTNEPLISL